MFFELLIICLFSLALGSFSNNYISSFLNENKPDFLRSLCFCGKEKLNVYDLMPILSFFLLKGKCRFCNNKIPSRYLVVEIAALICGLTSFYLNGYTAVTFLQTFILVLFVNIAIIDLRKLLIPNLLVALLFIAGVIINFLESDFGLINIYSGVVSFIVFILIKVLGSKLTGKEIIGMGDIKFITVLFTITVFPVSLIGLWISSVIGMAGFFITNKFSVQKNEGKIPFGFYLAITYSLIMLFEYQIYEKYLELIYF